MKTYETRSVEINFRESITDDTFTGYASVFNNLDSHGTKFAPTAFNRTLSHTNGGEGIPILWQHNPFEPIGKPIRLSVDNHGLQVEAKISDTPRGNEALTLINDGVINGLSIGFTTLDYEFDEDDNLVFTEVRLMEVSVVTFPSNSLARVRAIPVAEHARSLANLMKEGAEVPSNALFLHEMQIRSILNNEPHALRKPHAPRDSESLEQALVAWRLQNRYGAQK